MSALSMPCWTSDNARAILRTEALSGEDEVFLATHTPVESFDVAGSHASDVQMPTEQGLLDALSRKGLQHAWCVVQGEPGSGKSHVIRWLDVNWPHADDERLLIQRANGSLDGTLRQLQRKLPEFQHLFEGLKQQQAAGIKGRASQFLLNLGGSLAADHFATPPEDNEWCRRYEPDKIILSARVRDNWAGPARVLDIINGGATRNSASAVFTLQDLEQLVDLAEDVRESEKSATLTRRLSSEFVHVREALEEGRTWDDIAKDTLVLPESTALVNALNARRNHAVQSVLGVSSDGLKRLFEELRAALQSQGRRLVLLLEDVTSWQGVDDHLIDVLTTDATTRPEKDLCPLISVVGVTPDYYEQDLRGNYQQRITINVRLGKGDGRFEEIGTLKDSDKRAGFTARYLSAARTGEVELKAWRERLRTEPSLAPPNPCIQCPRSERCHAAFGEVEGIGLFPFTRTAVDTFFEALNSDAGGQTYRTPRGLLQGVLAPTLLNPNALADGAYPGPLVESSYLRKVHLTGMLDSQLRERVPEDSQRDRLRRLFAYWGDNRPILVKRDDDLQYAGVSQSVVEAFDLPWIAGDARVAPTAPAPVFEPVEEPEVDSGGSPDDAEAGPPVASNRRVTRQSPVAKPVAVGAKALGRKALEQRLGEIEHLEGDGPLPNAAKWNEVVFDVMRGLDVRRLGVDPWTYAKVFTAETPKIAGAGGISQRNMVIPRTEWLKQGLKAYVSLKTDNADLTVEEIEYARRRLAALTIHLEALAQAHLRSRLPTMADDTPWRPLTVAVQVLLARAWLRGAVSPTAPLAHQWRVLLSDEAEIESAPTLRTKAWLEVVQQTSRKHGDFRAMVHDMVSLPQGTARNFGLADLSAALPAMISLQQTLKLAELPPEDSKAAVGDLPNLRDLAERIEPLLPQIAPQERGLVANRAEALLPLLRSNGIRAHLERLDGVIRAINGELTEVAAVEVREWIEMLIRNKRLIEDRDLIGRVQMLMLEIADRTAGEDDTQLLAWLIEVPATELKTLLDLAQKGEGTLAALAPHVRDLIEDAGGGDGLEGLRRKGEGLAASAVSAEAALHGATS